MIETKSKSLKKAVVILKRLSADEKMTLLYEQQEKVRMDDEDRIEGAFNNGLARGKAEGLREGELKGKAEGLKEGKAEGLKEGEIKNKIDVIIMLVSKHGFRLKSAMVDVGLGDEYKSQIISELEKLNIKFEE